MRPNLSVLLCWTKSVIQQFQHQIRNFIIFKHYITSYIMYRVWSSFVPYTQIYWPARILSIFRYLPVPHFENLAYFTSLLFHIHVHVCFDGDKSQVANFKIANEITECVTYYKLKFLSLGLVYCRLTDVILQCTGTIITQSTGTLI